MPAEIAIDVLAAANMINLPRLVHIAEFALQAVRIRIHAQNIMYIMHYTNR